MNLCGVNEATGFCVLCQQFCPKPRSIGEYVCLQYEEQMRQYDPDTGEYLWDGDESEQV